MLTFYQKTTFLLVILFVFSIQNGATIRTKDQMYAGIDAAKACFRRLNATHQIGCSSERGGSTGAIHYCETQADLNFIFKNGTAPPYVPVLPTELFTVENLNKLKKSAKIAGVVLYSNAKKLDSWSHENQCPNPLGSLTGTCKAGAEWNLHGTGVLYQDLPFPVFYVKEEDLQFTKDCFEKHNNFSFNTQRDRSLCSLQLVSFMFATDNSKVCIRRTNMMTNLNPAKYCDPLGDRNVWSSLFPLVGPPPLNEPIRDFKYIIIAAKLDTTSLFEITEGAISPVTGLVTLLATAKYLNALFPSAYNSSTNVLYVVFNGESYEYIGSQRFVYDLLQGEFPVKSDTFLPKITLKDIQLFVELSQLNNTGTLYAHSLNNNAPRNFIETLRTNSKKFEFVGDSLPPSSLHSFLKNSTDLPSLVLTDHKTVYANPYYNSIYDNGTNLIYKYLNLSQNEEVDAGTIQAYIQQVSTALGRSLYKEITGSTPILDTVADVQLIDELFHCYLENGNCRVHQAIQHSKLPTNQTFSLYVGVEPSLNFITSLVGLTLGWLTGNITGEGNINCTNDPKNYAYRYYNMSKDLDTLNSTKCFRITMNFTDAISPAFIIDDYDWTSGQYSTWTESTWGELRLTVFLKPSAAHENMTIAIGSMVFIISLLFVYFVNSRSQVLFAPHVPSAAPTNC